ncbi:MAG: insulinase family protein [Verrucomicrobia bacterium]|nr:insulinase family protein [Verrucomicrobiota bacterium]
MSLFRTPPGLALFLALVLPLAAAPRFAHEGSDLKPDPVARFGRLDNGLRYVVYPNAEPKGRASLRLLVLAGSLHEEEDQRGVAHFLEHMAFNGSKHFAPGTLVEFFQRMGMSFGGDTNASTGFDRTLYLLELPETSEKTLAEGIKVFSDYASGLLLTPEEIDKERGIILSEKRARDSVSFRTFEAQFGFMLGETLLPRRMPIGTAEVIQHAPRERFVSFWDRWYRPEKMAAIVVGDVDPALAERLIRETFGTLAARGPAPADPALGRVTRFEGVRGWFHHEAEGTATSVSISTITPYQQEPDTTSTRIKRLPRFLATTMLSRRFSVLAKQEQASFSSGRASISNGYRLYREGSIDLTCKPDQWAAALAVGEQELRRALEHGFLDSELREARANQLNALERAVRGAATRRSSSLAGELAQGVLDERVFTTPADELALYRPALEKITTADCVAALREAFTGNGRYVMVSGNARPPDGAGSEAAARAVVAAYAAAQKVPVTPPAAEAEARWAYTDFGPTGQVAKRVHVPDLDVTLVTFANGVRLNLKKTDFEAGRIQLGVRVGGGSMTAPPGQRGLAMLAGSTFSAGGLGKHSTDDLRRLLAGRNAGVSFGIDTDAFVFSAGGGGGGRGGRGGRGGGGGGGTTREDLLLTLQLVAAYLTDPGYRPEALRLTRTGIEQMYTGFAHTPNGPLSMEIANLIAGGDPRFGVPAKETLLARNLDEVRAWLAPQFARGAIEIAMTGDLDPDAAIDAVARTLAALPSREPRPAWTELRRVAFPAQPFTRDFVISSEIPKGLVALYWPTADAQDVRRARRLTMLASVFSDRLRVKIREEMGGTYSPRASSFASDTYTGYGYLTTSIDVDPAMAEKVREAVVGIADDLAKNGVTAEELERARLPARTAVKESLRTNGYWLGSVLARAQEKPEVLDWARTRTADMEAITAEELGALARQYLGREKVSRVTILPGAK